MAKPTVVWWNHERMSFSCCYMLNEMFDHYGCEHLTPYNFNPELRKLSGGILVFHGANAQSIVVGPKSAELINDFVRTWQWCIFVSIGDEATEFPLHLLSHPNSKLWVQAPLATTPADRYLIQGYPDHTKRADVERDLDYFFSGQITHQRRINCQWALSRYWDINPNGMCLSTSGFNQGLPQEDYLRHMSRAKIVPCPAGAATVDTFRVYEALECGAVPLLDSKTSQRGDASGVWKLLLADHPLLVIDEWNQLPHILPPMLEQWESLQRWTQAWWRAYKYQYQTMLARDLISLGAVDGCEEERSASAAQAT